jgi:MerR family transcriptional regulator/heat shock protein HspR
MRRRTTRVTVSSDRGVFMISVAAELAEMHPQTLRMYEQRGLIEPKRSPKGTRLYSQDDVEQLRRIQGMTNDLGLNLAGVEHVLKLEQELERSRRRLDALERRTEELQAEMAAQVEAVRREYRAELVPLKHTRAIVPVRDTEPRSGPSTPGARRIPVQRDGRRGTGA